jgi:hypothetical protein
VTYSRAHQNDCLAVHTSTDAAREAILSEATRVAQQAQTARNKQREEDETERKAAEKLAQEVAATAATANEAPDAPDAASQLAADTLVKRKAARVAAEKQFIIITADVKTTQDALATAQAACTKTSKDVALAQQHTKATDKVKRTADEVHKASVLQLTGLEKGVADAKSMLKADVKRKAAKQELEKLSTAASIAETDKKGLHIQVLTDGRTKRKAATELKKRRRALLPPTRAAAKGKHGLAIGHHTIADDHGGR